MNRICLSIHTLCVTSLLLCAAGTATADPTEGLDRDEALFWQQNWRKTAGRYCQVGEDYFTCEKWDASYPSSMHVSVSQWQRENSEKKKIRQGLLVKTAKYVPDRAEAEAAATTLPTVRVGEYGYIHSARVTQVLGPNEMIVGDIWIVDEKSIEEEKEAELEKIRSKVEREMKAYEAERKKGRTNRTAGAATRPPNGKEAMAEVE